MIQLRLLVVLVACLAVQALENGLARTPPMGWMTWERFGCIIDCEEYPNECISEKLFKEMADVMSSEGYLKAGYEYIIIDDCWLSPERTEDGKLQPDPIRFPSGIKALADYVHSKGLKFGIYEDYGTKTCAGYPGILRHLENDARTFAEWDVDYLKIDGCNADVYDMPNGYEMLSNILNATGRPMVFSCSYPAYEELEGKHSDYKKLSKNCNLWRNYADIQDSWASVKSIIDFYTKNQDRFGPFNGPGHWNDPDMLIIGNFGLSYDQSRAQMAIWAIMASPLIMSNDLRNIRPEFKEILLNEDVIRINQDPLGIQGRMVKNVNYIQIFTKPIVPIIRENYSYAIAFLNDREEGSPYKLSITLEEIGLDNKNGYKIQNIFDPNEPSYVVKPGDKITARVNPSGVVLLRATVLESNPTTRNALTSHLFYTLPRIFTIILI